MSDPEKSYSTAAAKDKKKARVPNILLSRDFFTKPRNRKWIKEHGSDAVIILLAVWNASSQETNCKIRKDEAVALPYPLPFLDDKITTVLESAVEVGLLDADQEHYFNSQIVEASQAYQERQQNYSNGRQKRDRKQEVASEDSPRILEESSENHIKHSIVNNKDLDPRKIATPGFVDLGDGVRISVTEYDALKLEFARFELPEKWIGRAAAHCANQDNQKYKNGPFRYLKTWGIQRCLEEKEKLARARNTEKIAQKLKDPNEGRPRGGLSPPTIDPDEAVVIRHPPLKHLITDLTKKMSA